jgi:SAM-dependent methyltransferase
MSAWREDGNEDVASPIDLRDPEDVRKWLETAETVRPWRPQLRRCIAELLRDRFSSPLRVLELGPGPGLLAETILQTCSVASYTLLDFSPPFLEMCRERVGDSGVARFVLGDFKQPDWPALVQPPYDAVVSMQAVHELRHKRHAAALYAQALPVLRPGGLLIVCDHMPKDDPRSRALHATEAEQHSALSAAGFEEVTTHLLINGMYVCSGRRRGWNSDAH